MGKKVDLTDKIFGKLTVIKDTGKRYPNSNGTKGNVIWECQCECGNIIEVPSGNLTRPNSRKCRECSNNIFFERDGYMVGLTRKNEEFWFDKKHLERVNKHTWHLDNKGYVVTEIMYKLVRLHRFLLNPPNDMQIDHIYGKKFDNRDSELKICTQSENQINKSKYKTKTSSKYKGVSYNKRSNKWIAEITHNKEKIYLGRYKTEIEAAQAYNEASNKYHQYHKILNKIEP